MSQTDREFASTNPGTGEINWTGLAADQSDVDAAVNSARGAFPSWSALPMARRIEYLETLADKFRLHREELAEAISRETGKPKWESLTEVEAMIGKLPISVKAQEQRCPEARRELPGATGIVSFRPHGVLGVLGPFNMPGHLPNGHIMPALLAGNTVVFKSSEQTPLVGEIYARLFYEAGIPRGAMNLLQGAASTGALLANHPDINGILFTGSTAGGLGLRRALADHPEKILALEMGGNNPLIVSQTENLVAAAILIIQSAFITSGQRCSCARRLIVCPVGRAVLDKVAAIAGTLKIGLWNDDPQPFMGTVISASAARAIAERQDRLLSTGAQPILKMQIDSRSAAMLTPGMVDVTHVNPREDVEVFGPLLQVIHVKDLESAWKEANRTSYGLSAGLISDNRDEQCQFAHEARAGVLSINRPTTGASSHLPFGGMGRSGNHRPGGYLAADYCSSALASLEAPKPQLPRDLPPGLTV